MTFTFTMDAFPDYTQFDKQHKVFASIQIIGDENIHPDTLEDMENDDECQPLKVEITAAKGGAAGWTDNKFADDPREILFTSLGNNLGVSIDRANLDFKGNLRRIENWTAFSSSPADLTGYYYPFTLEAADGTKLIRKGLSGTTKTLTFGQTGDGAGKMNLVWAIDPKAPVITVELESADGANKEEYSFDFSKVVFK